MNKSKIILFIAIPLIFHTAHAASLVFIQGTSRSGKSSIARILAQHEQWKVIAPSYRYYCYDFFAQTFPQEFAIIRVAFASENITYALRRNIFFFKHGLSKEEKDQALLAIRRIQESFNNKSGRSMLAVHMQEYKDYTINMVTAQCSGNSNILVDTSWYLKKEELHSLYPNMNFCSILTYCPFSIMVERIIAGNIKAQEQNCADNHRFFKEGLQDFMRLYNLTSSSQGAIDTICRTEVDHSLALVEASIQMSITDTQSKFIVKEFSAEQFREYKESLINKFAEHEILYVVPCVPYEILIRTDKKSSQECVYEMLAAMRE